ncbi:MAG: hypothetical protein HY868_24140 [Chloroflexi bacterium]|nr:hypothetical protein [Chloroflexota bacterium]
MPILIGPHRLSPEFIEKRKLRRHCTDNTCSADCCAEGVFLTLYDAQRIVQLGDALQPYLVEPFDFAKWDLSRPSYLSTPVYQPDTPHEHCWFRMRNKLCAIHSYALEHGIKIEELKPYFCRMFPLTLIDIAINVTEIGVDIKAYDTCLVESDQEHWLFEQFETELRRVIGDDGYVQLRALAQQA